MALRIYFANIQKHHRLAAMMLFAMAISVLRPAITVADEPSQIQAGVSIPDDWLAWATIPKVENLEEQADQLLEAFGIRLVGAKQILQAYCGNALADNRPIMIGFAASQRPIDKAIDQAIDAQPSKQLVSPEPFLILPIDDLEKFARARQFSMQEDLWLTTLFGVEFRITPREKSIGITRLDSQVSIPSDQQIDALLGSDEDEESDLTKLLQLSLSKRGFNYLLATSSAERKALLSLPRKKIPTLKLPKNLPEFQEQLTRYVPFLEAISEASSQEEKVLIDCDVHLAKDSIELKLRFASDGPKVAFKNSDQNLARESSESASQLNGHMPDQKVITHIASEGRIDKTLLDLAAGYFFCYPDEVEANTYNKKAYQEYTDQLNALMQSSCSMELIDLLTDKSEPLVAGQAILLDFPEEARPEVANQLTELIDIWNQLLVASKARLKFEAKQETIDFELASGKKLEAIRVSIDMIKALGGRRYEEIVALFEAIYGPDCIYQTDIINLGDGRWLLSRLPQERNEQLVQKLLDNPNEKLIARDTTQPWQLTAKINPALYQDWNVRLDKISHSETIGHRPLRSMAECQPIRIDMTRQQNQLHANVKLPLDTYRASVEFYRKSARQ